MAFGGRMECAYICPMFHKNIRIPIAFMVISLVLLLGFIGWFLQNAWQAEYKAFQTEADLLMTQTVREIEAESFQQMLQMAQQRDSSNVQWIETGKKTKSLKSVVFYKMSDTSILQNNIDQKKNKKIQLTFESDNAKEGPKGIVSTIIEARIQGSSDSLAMSILPDTGALAQKLTDGLRSGLRDKGMSIEFVLDKKPLNTPTGSHIATAYNDLNSHTRYEMSLSDYHAYIARRILPEILFSLFLFAITALSFYLIFKHLRAQQRLNEVKSEFTRNITHELKTPIATAGVAVEALLDFGGINNPERTREYLQITKTELARLGLLVDRVLKMSAFDEQGQVVQKAPTNLRDIAEQVLATLQPRFAERQAVVDFVVDDNAQFEIMGDKLHLTNMLYNLLDNALKYSPDQPHISLHMGLQDGKVRMTVRDQGIGIPEVYRQQVFEKYFRVPTGDVHNVKGHGLGLSYVASVVAAHGGKVSIESVEGGGTVVVVVV